ncbi:transporter substrate-binding domain-containing protein [Jiella sp. MQZ9-1]|uniref:Transporter substrate-binding domain-containing protein n=1 Tax=Jiella flava TaxID=2816857 RepID=A0A939FVX1_9HYPH|nr:transporter substrate-binding domain-containing protein [Jiella flava]MBO0661226.1 transporter substrate-binding domain-containing protein [Jiella flava]MCD2469871.1 transporter substrate-binding domain-containing protein [Jiella flava]
MMNRRNFVARIAAAALALTAAVTVSPALADGLAGILQRGTLRVAVPQDFPPFGSVGADMSPQGYDIDMAELVAGKMGVKLQLVPVTSTNRIPYLQTNKVDLVISSLGKNPDREKVIDFSDAYAPFFNGVFGPKDSGIAKPADLSGKIVGVTRGSVEDLQLSKIAPKDATIKRYEDNNGTISAFLSNQVDVVATGNVVAAAILKRNPPRQPDSLFLMKNSPCYVGLSKGEPKLMAKVNEIIAEAKKDGSLDKVSEKWLGAKLPKDL